mgnify:FL=1
MPAIASADVAVVGLGVAGSALAAALAQKGFRVVGYDLLKRYVKPCGEQITVDERSASLLRWLGWDVVKTVVDRVDIYVAGRLATTASVRPGRWVIVDKAALVERLRDMARGYGAYLELGTAASPEALDAPIIVDARGPYARSPSGEVLAVRLIARVSSWDPQLARLDFRPKERGLYWVFPSDGHGRLVNAGAGFVGVSDATAVTNAVIKYLKETVSREFQVVDVRGAPIDVFGRPRLVRGRALLVGEAAGLVMTWSGEGNRPAIGSALALSDAIAANYGDRDKIFAAYSGAVGDLLASALISRLTYVLVMALRAPEDFLTSLPRPLWEGYVAQDLSLKDIVRGVAGPLSRPWGLG